MNFGFDALDYCLSTISCHMLFIGIRMQFSMYIDGIIKFFVFLAIYLGWSFIFKPEAYTYFLTIIPAKFRFWEKKTMNK